MTLSASIHQGNLWTGVEGKLRNPGRYVDYDLLQERKHRKKWIDGAIDPFEIVLGRHETGGSDAAGILGPHSCYKFLEHFIVEEGEVDIEVEDVFAVVDCNRF